MHRPGTSEPNGSHLILRNGTNHHSRHMEPHFAAWNLPDVA